MNENKTYINWYPGHMAKTKNEIREKMFIFSDSIQHINRNHRNNCKGSA